MFVINWLIAASGFGVGIFVGLTGMGGGALMLPILVLLFGIPPTTAVASDLVAALAMKPFGAAVHFRRGTVNRPLVRLLTLGSVPSAFAGSALINHLGRSAGVQHTLKSILGGVLLLAAVSIFAKALLTARRHVPTASSAASLGVKVLPTILIGVVGGLIVGMTSVGSGSLIVVMLMLVYPRLSGSELVGTDLAQAIPLVGAAALGHVVFGHVHFDLTASLLVGSIPGVLLGAHLSSRSHDRWLRPSLVVVLAASALKLLAVSNVTVAVATTALLAVMVARSWTKRPSSEGVKPPPDEETTLVPAE